MVNKTAISATTLMSMIAYARPTSSAVSEAEALLSLKSQLLRYRDDLISEGRETVTVLAIENWFRPEKRALPTHKPSKRFLNGYLTRLASRMKVGGERQRTVANILKYLESAGLPQITAGRKVGAIEKADPDTLLEFLALRGTYQLIRPHSVEANAYILEPFAIEVNEDEKTATVQMYSHNQRAGDLMYTGDLYASNHYGYSLIRRRYAINSAQMALRCISFFMARQRQGEGYLPQPCVSGLISRGVAGLLGPSRIMGTPFLAIKAPDYSANFSKPDFDDFGNELRRLHKNGSILSGKLSGGSALHRLCHDTFLTLKRELVSGLVLYAIEPDKVEAAIARAGAGQTKELFTIWTAAIKAQFSGHQVKKSAGKKRETGRGRKSSPSL